MEIVISQKVFVSGQKYSRIVLRTCVGPFGVNMNKIWDVKAWAIGWVDAEWPIFVMNWHIACGISMQNICMAKLFIQKKNKVILMC